MFTGIIEEIGTILNINKIPNGAILNIDCAYVLSDTKIGDSIAVNGVCQTVTEISKNSFSVFCSYETLSLTTLGSLNSGDKVNLERALRLSDRLGGHIVSGHVDGVGKLISATKVGDSHKMTFSADKNLMHYVVKKGSVAIDGISLTVCERDNSTFSAAVIPHTYKNTLLKDLQKGSAVNIETDILGKYIENFLLSENNKSNITPEFLIRNGF